MCEYATKVVPDDKMVKDFDVKPVKKGFALKIPVFSFSKFPNVNKEPGRNGAPPEMKSTGEGIFFIDDPYNDFFQKIYPGRNLYPGEQKQSVRRQIHSKNLYSFS